MNKKFLVIFLVLFSLATVSFVASISDVSAVRCIWNKTSQTCKPRASGGMVKCAYDSPDVENCGKCLIAYGGNGCVLLETPGYDCGNDFCECPAEPQCSCTPRACPAVIAQDKFRTRPVGNGTAVTCANANDCNPGNPVCASSYFNTPPSCSMVAASLTFTSKSDAPKPFSIITNDADYGDTVQVTNVRVTEAGNLKSCVKITTVGGSLLNNLTVKPGSNNAADTSFTTNLLADPRGMHGIFDRNLAGQSVCTGEIEIEIRDVDSDGAGPDVSDFATCKIGVTVYDQPPVVSNIQLLDRDADPVLRDPNNLVNGSTVYVGSPLAAKRASYCTAALSKDTLGQCLGTNIASIHTRKNPLLLSFTVTDPNGLEDIMSAGVWIQKSSFNATLPAYPTVSNGSRNSFQALYLENENIDISGAGSYFQTKACLGPNCNNKDLASSNEQKFAGLNIIWSGSTLTSSQFKTSPYREWQKVGFPDCLATASGCGIANVPTLSRTLTDHNVNTAENYQWNVGISSSQMLCFRNNTATPEVRPNQGICLDDCAACITKEGVSEVGTNGLNFKFGLYFNDRDSATGGGLAEGQYSIFLHALDKVGVPLHNVTGKGPEGWLKFDKNGTPCTGATCPAGDFTLIFDTTAPKVTNISPQIPANVTADDQVQVNMLLSDSSSKLAGRTNAFMIHQELVGGEPLERIWMKPLSAPDCSSPLEFNGANDYPNLIAGSPASTTISIFAKCALPNENIVAGACAYDNAGNMGCGALGDNYIFVSPWFKTSLGDIYSNTATGGNAFKNYTIPNTPDSTAASNPAPFSDQANTAATGVVMTAGNINIMGGHSFSPSEMYQLGFSTNAVSLPKQYYRTTGTSPFNVSGIASNLPGNEYERVKGIALKNCDLLNSVTNDSCIKSNTIANTATLEPYKLITLSGVIDFTSDIICQNKSLIFIEGGSEVTLKVQVKKQSINSGCIFVLGNNVKFAIKDVPAGDLASGDKTKPDVDLVEAGIIASGATVTVEKGSYGTISRRADRLVVRGFLYSSTIAPMFSRYLAPVDNKKYPSEYFIYDATLLDSFRALLGFEKTVDVVCGTSTHIFCGKK